MRESELEMTDLETAILAAIASENPSVQPLVRTAQVVKREFTGAGSFTEFESGNSVPALGDSAFDLGSLIINVPGQEHGMGAELTCKSGKLHRLEIFTLGVESWDGNSHGFSITVA